MSLPIHNFAFKGLNKHNFYLPHTVGVLTLKGEYSPSTNQRSAVRIQNTLK